MQWTCTGTSFSRSMAEQNCSKILVRRILEIHRNMDVGHAKTVDARRLVRQRLVMGVEPQVDNVADAESVDIGQLRFGRLAGCRYPIIETTPVVDRFRVGHGTPAQKLKSSTALGSINHAAYMASTNLEQSGLRGGRTVVLR